MFSAALASFDTIRDDMRHQSSIDGTTDDDGARLENINGSFELKQVSFKYPSRPDTVILQGLNLVIPAGQHTAIVGMSGSGKSTIAGLLMRLYDPTDGQILLDGKDLRTLNTRQLRSYIGLVQQEPSLLNRSILENIAHGLVNSAHPDHSRLVPILLGPQLAIVAESVRNGTDMIVAAEEQGALVLEIVGLVRKAAALADATNFILSLKDNYGTLVGVGGRLVSGGQKQRIALARALIKDPKILILDEATAALDSASEQRIQAAMSKVALGRTLVTIAHRLATVKHADKIIVLKEGMILEEGSHTTLVAEAGTYASLVQMQTIGADTNEDLGPLQSSLEVGAVRDTFADEKRHDHASQQEVEPSSSGDEGSADPEDEVPATSSRSMASAMGGLLRFMRPFMLIVVMALLAASIVGGSFSAEAVIFGNTVGRLNPCKTESSIRSAGNFFGLMFFVLAIIEFFANLVSWSAFGWLSEKMLYIVRLLSFRSLLGQNLQWHQSENRTPAKLLLYITKDGNALAALSGSVLGTIFSISVNLVVAIVLTHIIAWKIALVCLALVPLLLGAGLMELRVLGNFEDKHENAFAESVDISVEAITSIKTVAALGLEKETLGTYRRSLKGPRKETTAVSLQASLWLALMYFLGNMVNALAYWWGSKQIIAGTYTQTQFLIVVFSLLVSAMLWSQMFALAPELSSAWAAVARILDLIDIGPTKDLKVEKHWAALPQSIEKDVEALAEAKEKSSMTRSSNGSSVSLRSITFTYPARPDMKVLQGLQLEIPSGQFCALVGPSGAGKSTVISLIEGMYKPQSGSILIDGIDITRQKDFSFRDEISLVPQDSVLFEGTVAFNVGLGARPTEEASRADIEEACRLANIHETIVSLPQGYDTLCGPSGSQLSGGQRQRLSIARALVRKPRLLILDESTSALDAESEKLLQEGLAKASKGITVIAIAHRLHTIKQANVIFLIEGGKCVDHGSHSELFQRSESYRSNVLHQTLGDVEQVA
ncbi:P-loop containing nucleoside triphosphate hydrolase protein [Exophiala viscosa]|uniref:P-loop containing nucleoside triphosphate hydrolase protein n=1 Tax=Exophiala viscosa TaxID=2486360 RepID=UPI00219C88C3|nr:P-loop containing nucleoside triphosphate hydrolase protein [Exophiala viscosa]